MDIRLLVLRTKEIETLSNFYSLLGLNFEYHQHGKSPFHYSASIGQTILEIYPLTKGQIEADSSLRIGFGIDQFDKIIEQLKKAEVLFIAEPLQTEFGYMAVIADPDGRKIELHKKS